MRRDVDVDVIGAQATYHAAEVTMMGRWGLGVHRVVVTWGGEPAAGENGTMTMTIGGDGDSVGIGAKDVGEEHGEEMTATRGDESRFREKTLVGAGETGAESAPAADEEGWSGKGFQRDNLMDDTKVAVAIQPIADPVLTGTQPERTLRGTPGCEVEEEVRGIGA